MYITFISVDAVLDVDSDSDLRLELGARLGLAFSQTHTFACFGCGLPVRCVNCYISEAVGKGWRVKVASQPVKFSERRFGTPVRSKRLAGRRDSKERETP